MLSRQTKVNCRGVHVWTAGSQNLRDEHLPQTVSPSVVTNVITPSDWKLWPRFKTAFRKVVLIVQLGSHSPLFARNWLLLDLYVCVLTPVIYIGSMPVASWLVVESYYVKLWISMLKGGGWFIDPWQRCICYIGLIWVSHSVTSWVKSHFTECLLHNLTLGCCDFYCVHAAPHKITAQTLFQFTTYFVRLTALFNFPFGCYKWSFSLSKDESKSVSILLCWDFPNMPVEHEDRHCHEAKRAGRSAAERRTGTKLLLFVNNALQPLHHAAQAEDTNWREVSFSSGHYVVSLWSSYSHSAVTAVDAPVTSSSPWRILLLTGFLDALHLTVKVEVFFCLCNCIALNTIFCHDT